MSLELLSLPSDVLVEICSHLHPRDLLHLARVCRAFSRYSSIDRVWLPHLAYARQQPASELEAACTGRDFGALNMKDLWLMNTSRWDTMSTKTDRLRRSDREYIPMAALQGYPHHPRKQCDLTLGNMWRALRAFIAPQHRAIFYKLADSNWRQSCVYVTDGVGQKRLTLDLHFPLARLVRVLLIVCLIAVGLATAGLAYLLYFAEHIRYLLEYFSLVEMARACLIGLPLALLPLLLDLSYDTFVFASYILSALALSHRYFLEFWHVRLPILALAVCIMLWNEKIRPKQLHMRGPDITSYCTFAVSVAGLWRGFLPFHIWVAVAGCEWMQPVASLRRHHFTLWREDPNTRARRP